MLQVQKNVQLQFASKLEEPIGEKNLPIQNPIVDEAPLPLKIPVDEPLLLKNPVDAEPIPNWRLQIRQKIQQKKLNALKAAEEEKKANEEVSNCLKEIGKKRRQISDAKLDLLSPARKFQRRASSVPPMDDINVAAYLRFRSD